MSEKKHNPMEDVALALYYHVARRIKEGKSHELIVEELVEQGISAETAQNMLRKLDQSRSNVAQRNGYRNAGVGVVLIPLMIFLIGGFGIIEPVAGLRLGLVVIMLAGGVFLLGRGLLQIMRL